MIKKSNQYGADMSRFFERIRKLRGDEAVNRATYAGYEAWADGYKAGFAAGKAKGSQEAEDKFRA